jgi:hypothetical protein
MSTELTMTGIQTFIQDYVSAARVAQPTYSITTEDISGLVDKIGKMFTITSEYKNLLDVFDYGKLELGADVEEWFDELLLPEAYDNGGAWTEGNVTDVLSPRYSIVDKAYHLQNLPFKFAKSYPLEQVKQAFISEEAYMAFIGSLIGKIADAKSVYKYEQSKALLDLYIAKAKASTTLATYHLNVEVPTDEDSSKGLLKLIKNDLKLCTFPRQDTSINGHVIQSSKTNMVLIVNYKAITSLNVDARSNAFNVSELDIGCQVVEIDDLVGSPTVLAVLVDKRALRVYEDIGEVLSQPNNAARFITYFSHNKFTLAASPFAPIAVYDTATA